jgi:RNA polymerase sigma factor (sigma-70 family)
MARTHFPSVLRQIQRAVRDRVGALPDEQLLERFLSHGDGAAFEVIVWRHGPMVFSVCRRLVPNLHDAEDVFQATFLLLARRAGSIARGRSLAAWLYKVAHRTALRARARSRKYGASAFPVTDIPARADREGPVWRELRPLLDEAIQRLPERYRTPIILCYLEGNSYREAAASIGCPVSTLSTRLMRARELLRRHLCRRGITLPATVVAAVLAEQTLAAAPAAGLVEASVNAATSLALGHGGANLIPQSVAALADEAGTAALGAKAKAAILLLLTVGVIAGGVVAAYRATGHPEAPKPALSASRALPPPTGPTSSAARPAAAATVIVRGRVLGPDGRPVAHAKLYRPGPAQNAFVWSTRDLVFCGDTDKTGAFHAEVPQRIKESGDAFCLLAAASGFGVDWADPFRDGGPSELTLRLVKDQPIRGRLLTTEGKPVAGVRLSVRSVRTTFEENLDEPLERWKFTGRYDLSDSLTKRLPAALDNALKPAVSDANGRFEIASIGVDRVALIVPMGVAVAQGRIYAVTRPGMDFLAYDRAVWKNAPLYLRPAAASFIHLRGPLFDYTVTPARMMQGTVRDAATGLPIARAIVATNSDGDGNTIRAITDDQGHYKIGQLPKLPSYELYVHPGAERRLLPRSVAVPAAQGLESITQDIRLVAGAALSGRVVDRATGKGVKSWIDFWPLSENGEPIGGSRSDERGRIRVGTTTDETGRFRLNVFPGRGLLAARAATGDEKIDGVTLNPYTPATPDLVLMKHLSAWQPGNACRLLDLGREGNFDCGHLRLERGRTVKVEIHDSQGKPLTGTLVSGLTASEPTVRLLGRSCTVYGLRKGSTRRLFFFDRDHGLAAALVLRGDETDPVAVRLRPTGSIRGRLLDLEGRPLRGIRIAAWSDNEQLSDLYDRLQRSEHPSRTDDAGRFMIADLLAGEEFRVQFGQFEMSRVAAPKLGAQKVAPRQTLDLGDIRTKPR